MLWISIRYTVWCRCWWPSVAVISRNARWNSSVFSRCLKQASDSDAINWTSPGWLCVEWDVKPYHTITWVTADRLPLPVLQHRTRGQLCCTRRIITRTLDIWWKHMCLTKAVTLIEITGLTYMPTYSLTDLPLLQFTVNSFGTAQRVRRSLATCLWRPTDSCQKTIDQQLQLCVLADKCSSGRAKFKFQRNRHKMLATTGNIPIRTAPMLLSKTSHGLLNGIKGIHLIHVTRLIDWVRFNVPPNTS